MSNMPEVKIGVVAVSRDCFPESSFRNKKRESGESLHREIWLRRNL